MRRLLYSLVFLLLSGICHAQPNSFFGLQFGEAYSQEQIIAAVGDNGEFQGFEEKYLPDGGNLALDTYFFANVKYDGIAYQLMGLQFSPNSKNFLMVVFSSSVNDENDSVALSQLYERMAEDVNAKYPMQPAEETPPSVFRTVYLNTFGTTVRLDKYVDENRITTLELAYIYTLGTAIELLDQMQHNPEQPEIQDSFLGLTFGKRYTTSLVKNAIGARGTFLYEERESDCQRITFSDVSFAGYKWDYGDVSLTNDGRFYYFNVYFSRLDISDEKKELRATFDYLKEKLDDKYGYSSVSEEDDELSVSYFGKNDAAAVLSLKKSRSKGGSFRLFCSLAYVSRSILDEVSNQSNDEL